MSNTTTPTQTVSRRVGLGKVEIAHAPAHLTAVLGSCVGIAIYDRQTATGTLAHIVMPHGKDQGVAGLSYAQEAIDESLTMLKESGCNLEAAKKLDTKR